MPLPLPPPASTNTVSTPTISSKRYTLSNFAKPEDFTTHRVEKPKLMSQLMLVWSARRPMTATHKATMALTHDVVSQALLAAS